MRTRTLLSTLWLAFALAAPGALAQQAAPAPLPEWEQLSPAQRDALIAPLRERWNAAPAERARMYRHARRWQAMTPDERARARHGMHRWEGMDAQGRQQARRIYAAIRTMTRDERKAFMAEWKAMNPAQREAWLKAHAPPATPPPRD